MALAAGTRLGHYEVVSSLGAGGMGEVYRAKDTKLGREVAIKLLLEEVSADPERLARFEREARVLASLNHPNIASLHAFERDGDTNFLVMELVEGETLADRLARGPIPIGQTIPLFLQIAEGLEAAHEKGVIHRDLKPANIKITDEGSIKVLDFGLAKALAIEDGDSGPAAVSESPTLTLAATMRGEILGTAAYMSPEQAAAKPVDKRTDIWAFGACLFEALTGRRAFAGEDVANTLAAVLRDEIELDLLPADCPPSLLRCLKRCLTRDRRRRLHDIADARLELEAARTADPIEETAPPLPARRSLATIAVVLVVGLLVGALLNRLVSSPSPDGGVPPDAYSVQRFTLSSQDRVDQSAAISPNGETVAYTTVAGIWVRDLSQQHPRLVPGTQGAATIFWSPDSKWIGYARGRGLWKIPQSGGEAVNLCDVPPGEVWSASWGQDGQVLFLATYGGRDAPLWRVAASGGIAEIFLAPDPATELAGFNGVAHLPDGEGVLVIARYEDETYQLQLRQGAQTETLATRAQFSGVAFSPTGHVLFSDNRSSSPELWAMPFSLAERRALGEPSIIASATQPSVSSGGALLYQTVDYEANQLAWVSRQGEILERLAQPISTIYTPRLSPDGSRVAFTGGAFGGDLYVLPIDGLNATRLTTDTFIVHPEFSPDGERIFYANSTAAGRLESVRRDGSGDPEILFADGADLSGYAPNWSQNGRYLVFYRIDPATHRDIWIHDGEAQNEAPYLQTPHDELHPAISPDGQLLAYQSNDQGRWEVWVDTFPVPTERRRVSEAGGTNPRWGPRGDELFFVSDNHLFAARMGGTGLSKPMPLFSGEDIGTNLAPRYDSIDGYYEVAPEGDRFLVVLGLDRGLSEVVLVRNWELEIESVARSK